MRKAVLAVVAGMTVMITVAELQAGSLAGVTMPDTQQVAGKTLALNGLGLRTKYMVKVYVAGCILSRSLRTRTPSSRPTRPSGSFFNLCTAPAKAR